MNKQSSKNYSNRTENQAKSRQQSNVWLNITTVFIINQIPSVRNIRITEAQCNINMFTLARIRYLDCQTTFFSSHFFKWRSENLRTGHPSGRFEPQNAILVACYTARKNHSTCFEAEIASKRRRIRCKLPSIAPAVFLICIFYAVAMWQNSLHRVGVGIFVSWASAKDQRAL